MSDDPATHRPVVSVIVVSYNTRERTLACVASVLADEGAPPTEVVVVDNASTDGSVDALRAAFPQVSVIDSGGNLGFARGVNLGARHARGDHLLLLNPDAELVPGSIAALVAAAERRPACGLYGGRVWWPDGRVNRYSARRLPTMWGLLCHGTGLTAAFPGSPTFAPLLMPRWDRTTEREVEMLTGALLLLPRSVFDRLGGFSEHYFLYGEDADLCRRALDLGYRPLFVPSAQAVHAAGSASPDTARKIVLMRTGEVTYLRDHWHGWRLRFGLAMYALAVASRSLASRVVHNRGVDWHEVWRARHQWLAGYPPRSPT